MMKQLFFFLTLFSFSASAILTPLNGGGGGGGNINSINGDTTASQVLQVGTSGTDFAIVDAGGGVHTFNLPSVNATGRGLITNGADTLTGVKTFASNPVMTAGTASAIVETTSGKALTYSTNLSTTLGGTGIQSPSPGYVLVGNGSSPMTPVAPGTSGNVLQSNGSAWGSSALSVNLATQVTGNLSVNSLAGGSGATSSTFWRGDGSWAAAGGGGGTVSGTSPKFAIFTGSTAVGNAAWTQGTNGEFQYLNYSSAKGTGAAPIVDLQPGTGLGMYAGSSGELYHTVAGVAAYHHDGTDFTLDVGKFIVGSGKGITASAGHLVLNAAASYTDVQSGGVNGIEVGTASGQTAAYIYNALAYNNTTVVASSTYTTVPNDSWVPVSFTATGAVTITIGTAGGYTGTAGRWIMVQDIGNNALVNNITIQPKSGGKMNGIPNGTCIILKNGGLAILMGQAGDDYSCVTP